MATLTDLAMVSLVVAMVLVVAAGVAKSARLAGRESNGARRLGMTVAAGLTVWLAVASLLAWSGTLSAWTSVPPRLPMLPLSALAVIVAVARTKVAKAMIASAPPRWPIAAQTFRIGVELVLFALHRSGRAPVQVTFEGRNFDVIVGITAPVLAWLVTRRRVGPALVVLWNALGLALLANAVVVIVTSVPGPLRLDWPGASFSALATWPLVWLPSFLAPLAVFLHIVSLRQAFHGLRASHEIRPEAR